MVPTSKHFAPRLHWRRCGGAILKYTAAVSATNWTWALSCWGRRTLAMLCVLLFQPLRELSHHQAELCPAHCSLCWRDHWPTHSPAFFESSPMQSFHTGNNHMVHTLHLAVQCFVFSILAMISLSVTSFTCNLVCPLFDYLINFLYW